LLEVAAWRFDRVQCRIKIAQSRIALHERESGDARLRRPFLKPHRLVDGLEGLAGELASFRHHAFKSTCGARS
jgi:hypothetical protein